MIFIAAIALLVGGVGIMNIMLVNVTERTREIGVRKALGATRRDIAAQFLVEAVTLTGVGGALGIACGLGAALAVRLIFDFPAAAPLWTIVLGFGVSTAIGLVFGLWPAVKAAGRIPSRRCATSDQRVSASALRSLAAVPAFDEQVRAFPALGLLLGGGGGGGDLVVAGEGSGRGLHRPDGQSDQGVEHLPVLAVLARVAAHGPFLGAEEAALAPLEVRQQLVAAPLPVRAAQDHQEIVAADVARRNPGPVRMTDSSSLPVHWITSSPRP